ncbi:MAG: hypothetical protein LAO78_03355 [Acidobacteriia bacterium]|nr:hypothetical protein [Terriglobia bacterium]
MEEGGKVVRNQCPGTSTLTIHFNQRSASNEKSKSLPCNPAAEVDVLDAEAKTYFIA